jgi:hypothetical protein
LEVSSLTFDRVGEFPRNGPSGGADAHGGLDAVCRVG